MKQTVVLLILDGWGIGARDYSNPIYTAGPKTFEYIRTHYPIGSLQSSGIAVGLPWEEEGNSEVGHLTIGAGKIIYQHYPRITLAIERGEFFKNPALLRAFEHARENRSAVHLVGMLTAGNVHASLAHLEALIDLASRLKPGALYLQLFSDGKDSAPHSVADLSLKAQAACERFGIGRIASVSGRFYAEDRDTHWSRTERAYQALVGEAPLRENVAAGAAPYYEKGFDDPFIEPFLVGPEPAPIRDNDAVIFFDFREDSIRQIVQPFVLNNFDKFPRKPLQNLCVVTFTNYADAFKVPVAFPSEKVTQPLGKVLADHGKIQLRVAETEKYAHVTYFMNGYRDEPFPNEYRIIIPSRNIPRHDERPEMMTPEVASRVIESIESGGFDFIAANFANSDMVAHTGNYDAGVEAVRVIDGEVARILKATLAKDALLLITADHGNLERMIDPLTGEPETKHDPSPVPFYLAGRGLERPKPLAEAERIEREALGLLSDVAPTILALMKIPKPGEMTGQNLLQLLA